MIRKTAARSSALDGSTARPDILVMPSTAAERFGRPSAHDAPISSVPAHVRGAAHCYARAAPGAWRLHLRARIHRRLRRQPSGLRPPGPRPEPRTLLQAHVRLPPARGGDGQRARHQRRAALGETAKADAAHVRKPERQRVRRDDQLAHLVVDGPVGRAGRRRSHPAGPRDGPPHLPDRRGDPVRHRHRAPRRRSRKDPRSRQPAVAGAARAHDALLLGPDALQPQMEAREAASRRHRLRNARGPAPRRRGWRGRGRHPRSA